MQQFGIRGISTAGVHNVPIFQITGVTSIDLDAAGGSYQNNPDTGLEWIDNVSWTRGRDFMKFGVDATRERLNGNKISSNTYGAYSFSGAYSGLGHADFRLGVPLFSFPTPFLISGTTSVQNVAGVNPHVKAPYTQQWNLTIEQELASVRRRLSYLGSRSVNLLYRRNLNQPPQHDCFLNQSAALSGIQSGHC